MLLHTHFLALAIVITFLQPSIYKNTKTRSYSTYIDSQLTPLHSSEKMIGYQLYISININITYYSQRYSLYYTRIYCITNQAFRPIVSYSNNTFLLHFFYNASTLIHTVDMISHYMFLITRIHWLNTCICLSFNTHIKKIPQNILFHSLLPLLIIIRQK